VSATYLAFIHRVNAKTLRVWGIPEPWIRSAFPLAFRLKCPTCAGYGHTGYDRRGRPIPCPACGGNGCAKPKREEAA
jgi:hypothetical protein